MLKRLINLLPMSRRELKDVIGNLTIVIEGLVEAEANHCQIEMNIIQKMQQGETRKTPAKGTTKAPNDPAFM